MSLRIVKGRKYPSAMSVIDDQNADVDMNHEKSTARRDD
jgi:hypothetical protein